MNLKRSVFKEICIFIIILLILSTSVMADNEQQVSDVKQYDLEEIGMKISLQNNFTDIIESMENNYEKVSNIENKDEYLEFAFYRTNICRDLYKKADEISKKLLELKKE